MNTDNGQDNYSPLGLQGQPVRPGMRPALAGRATYFAIPAVIALAVGACQSGLTPTTAVTVMSAQAGALAMNKDAPVTLLGSEVGKAVEVGKVVSTEALPNGQINLHLAIDSSQLHLIPENVLVKVRPPTAVQMLVPARPVPVRLHGGQVLGDQGSAASGAKP